MTKIKGRILILDDEEATLFAFKDALSNRELSVDTVQSLNEVEQLLSHKSYIGAVLDLRLKGTDEYQGFRAITLVKKYNPLCKIIVLTAYGQPDLKAKALEMGAHVFKEKPVSPNEILTIFQSLGR